jgi:hypothetical protein
MNKVINIVIPMVDLGKRFIDAGHEYSDTHNQ